MAWYSLTVDIPEDESELAQSVLYDHGAAGLEVRDSLNQTVLTVRAPAKGEAILIAYFEDKQDAANAQEELTEKIAGSRFAIEDALKFHKAKPLSRQLEIETYTWDVLPDHLKTGDIVDYVSREIEWVRGQLQ